MTHAGRRRLPNGSGIWVEGRSMFLLFFLLSPYTHELPGSGWMVSPYAPGPFFLRSFLPASFLGIVAVAG